MVIMVDTFLSCFSLQRATLFWEYSDYTYIQV